MKNALPVGENLRIQDINPLAKWWAPSIGAPCDRLRHLSSLSKLLWNFFFLY